ncbi:MAG: flavin reductase [Chloroflexi bacterium]|nr:flavin reductase [Chloroflexota bacterium]
MVGRGGAPSASDGRSWASPDDGLDLRLGRVRQADPRVQRRRVPGSRNQRSAQRHVPEHRAVSFENDAHTLENVRTSRVFTVNLLSQDEHSMELASRFAEPYCGAKVKGRAGAAATEIHHKLEGVEHTKTANGCPVLSAAMGWLEYSAEEFVPAGDHTIVIGAVLDGRLVREAEPIVPLVLGFVVVGAGIYLLTEAQSAKQEVFDALASEHIITPADATIPNAQVTDAETARSEMEWLEASYLGLTDGKRYAELDRGDPNLELVFEAMQLRTSLNLAVVEIRVAELAIALSVIIIVEGGIFVLFMTPTVYYSAQVADHDKEWIKRERL